MTKTCDAGRCGEKIRSDCFVSLELRDSGGIELGLKSKVEVMYGGSIRELCLDVLETLGVKNAVVTIEDQGALPFVISARLETAVKRCLPDNDGEYLPEMLDCSTYKSQRRRFRRSRLYLPGNEPKFMINAGIHKPDGIILDLEDSVAPAEKDAARILVRNALRWVDFYGAERMVRINQLPAGLEDLNYIVPHNVHVILIPKCESSQQVRQIDERIKEILDEKNIEEPVFLMPIIESALGVIKAYEIASASENIVALAVGLEDYTADIGAERTKEGKESFFARSQIVNAARAANVQPIDTVFSDVKDMEGLRQSTLEARSLGFEGKGCIHPRQLKVIHEAFAPTEGEIERAKRIVLAFERAEREGLGVVSLGSKMIDPPVVKRALRTVELAIEMGLLEKNWRDEYVR
ncbi:citrate lyase ACP [candidate division WOR-3 bacterium JGI_Cruoil_03_44_89]|uniref:Citrate lyase ACP n=1 Tax=candidate division WOR-3 bacterium JGI_Cruoil_03_44_89 TaxID=1973748 RepID=A0A235BV04_UNCW3|nr:MAG: citrate lyase ACP [candidate division WOR-3 bacterium JGI_Cruoil_03_44_89]